MRRALLIRLIVALLALLFVASCRELSPEPPRAKPTVELTQPGVGQEIAYDMPFVVSGSAHAPEGATLERVTIVLSGATSIARTAEISDQRFDVELTVPSDGRLGPDRLPLEARVTAIARVEGLETESEILRVPLVVVDKSVPVIEARLDPPGSMLAGFDAVYAPHTAFALSVRATDEVGGITHLSVRAPATLGGERSLELAPSKSASLVVAIDPPENADLELVISASDSAIAPNLAERTVRIRVGAGGSDTTAPALTFVAPATAECGTDLQISAAAQDDASGVERVELEGEGIDAIVFGPSPTTPLALLLNATFAVPRDRVLGSQLMFAASARDASGNEAPPRFYVPPIVDTRPPSLTAVLGPDASVVPGASWSALLLGSELCSVIGEASVRFIDPLATSTVTAAIGTESVNARVSFPVPEDVCTLGTIRTEVSLLDPSGNASAPVVLSLAGTDVLPPSALIVPMNPAARPGETIDFSVAVRDRQTPIDAATVTLVPIALELPSPGLMIGGSFPSSSCADRIERRIDALYDVPPDVRFLAPQASVHIEVSARDAAGNLDVESLDVPIIDDVPPSLTFRAPADGAVLIAGSTTAVILAASDRNHDVESVSLTVVGPAFIGASGTISATIAVGVASSTVAFELIVDAQAPLDAPIRLVAIARDSGGLAAPTSAMLALETCGTPIAVSVAPSEGGLSGDLDLLIEGSGFAFGALSASLGGTLLDGVVVDSATIAHAHLPLGTYLEGFVDLQMTNDCGSAQVSSTLSNAFRFVAPMVRAVRATRRDRFRQEVGVSRVLPIEAPPAMRLELFVERAAIATGETIGYAALSEDGDQRTREATSIVTVVSSNPDAISVDEVGQLFGLAPGTSTITATLGPLSASTVVTAYDRALVFAHGEVSAPARVQTLLLENGTAIDVTASSAFVSSSTVVTVDGALISGTGDGDATITASYLDLHAAVRVRVLRR